MTSVWLFKPRSHGRKKEATRARKQRGKCRPFKILIHSAHVTPDGGVIATLPVPVCGVFRPRMSPPESGMRRRVTLRAGRVSHAWFAYQPRASCYYQFLSLLRAAELGRKRVKRSAVSVTPG